MHRPLKRLAPGGRGAVLFIHGINATPRFFDAYAAAVPADWSVHCLLLPGHGGTVRDFAVHPAAAWEVHVRDALEELRALHERVYIVGHSLGALLAIREAVRDDRCIAGMVLLCVPLRIWSRPTAWVKSVRKGLFPCREHRVLNPYYGTEKDWRIWRYIGWIPRYRELFALSADARRQVAGLRVPTVAFMAGRDEQVSLRSERCMEGNPAITLRRMPRSGHDEFAPEDKAEILRTLTEMLSA